MIEFLRHDCVFELACMADKQWRAFYKVRVRHNDYPERPDCNYRSVVAATPEEAIRQAVAAWTTDRITR